MDRLTLNIDGMTCGHCVAAVRKELAAVSGAEIENVTVGSATVKYDPRVTTPEQIVEAIDRAGYAAVAGR
jgi:copper chaperone